ncbi:MAG TPA: hypothetical protein VGD54_10995, partial [Steroidobacteraceae bacterium]
MESIEKDVIEMKTPAKTRMKALGKWLIRVFALLGFGAAILIVVLFADAGYNYFRAKRLEVERQIRFAKLSAEAQRLATYDAFCDQIEKHYYDQAFFGPAWNNLRREWRKKD